MERKDLCSFKHNLINLQLSSIQQQAAAANNNNDDLIFTNLLKEKYYQMIFDFKNIDDLHVFLFVYLAN